MHLNSKQTACMHVYLISTPLVTLPPPLNFHPKIHENVYLRSVNYWFLISPQDMPKYLELWLLDR